jgi:hypothetical protein
MRALYARHRTWIVLLAVLLAGVFLDRMLLFESYDTWKMCPPRAVSIEDVDRLLDVLQKWVRCFAPVRREYQSGRRAL